MATTSSDMAFDRSTPLQSSSLRSGLRQSHTGGPQTPQRHRQGLPPFASTSSPGPSLRHDEDVVIVEMGSRWLRAGFEGESAPLCVVGFGREEGRRVGDYRGWIGGADSSTTATRVSYRDVGQWSKDHELWSMDIRDLDIGLVEDKIERAFRDIYNKYLLTDAGSSRLVLVLPSIVPHPLLSTLLSTLFHRWRYPSITLLPCAVMAAVAAGVRSALVVDIGWEETVVTSIYEYREVKTRRSTRAMRYLVQRIGTFLSEVIREKETSHEAERDDGILVAFEQCEDIMNRLSWCRKHPRSQQPGDEDHADKDPSLSKTVSVPLPTANGSTNTEVPFSKFSDLVEEALFAGATDSRDWDDEDMPLDVLAYNTLLALSPDVRGICMARLLFVGGGSHIPGIRQRILADTNTLVNRYNWTVARGKIIDKQTRGLQESKTMNGQQHGEDSSEPTPPDAQSTVPEPESNFIDEKLQRSDGDSKPSIQGFLREVESMGPWVGASLVANLKIRGLIEVEREKFLQHGLAGASRDADTHATLERRSAYGTAMARSSGERSSWTLGEWG